MVLLTLPYPPLPILAARVDLDDGRLADDTVINSHTLIAQVPTPLAHGFQGVFNKHSTV